MRARSSRPVSCRVRRARRPVLDQPGGGPRSDVDVLGAPCRTGARRAGSAARGFTLIELLVAMAALAILAAIALPAYFEQMARARRADVQAALLEDAGYMQHYYASHDAFTGTPPPQLPFAQAPRQGGVAYVITVAVPPGDPSTFVLTAIRAGSMAHDPCGDFTVDHLGRRELVAGSFAADRDAARCWR
ncbi:MAG: type IV pilin protein [Vitreoscilla sp.]